MSRENVAVAVQAFEHFQHRDFEGFLKRVDPYVEWHSLVLEMEGVFRGHAGVREWWTSLLDVFPDWKPCLIEVRDLGDHVLLRARGQGTGAGSGAEIGGDMWQVTRIRNGVIAWYAAFPTEHEALEAVGLSE